MRYNKLAYHIYATEEHRSQPPRGTITVHHLQVVPFKQGLSKNVAPLSLRQSAGMAAAPTGARLPDSMRERSFHEGRRMATTAPYVSRAPHTEKPLHDAVDIETESRLPTYNWKQVTCAPIPQGVLARPPSLPCSPPHHGA